MLINLTDKPFDEWTEKKRITVLDKYWQTSDIPFPNIDPSASHEDIEDLAEEYIFKCRELVLEGQKNAVYIMGEPNFCFTLILKLRREGFVCLASTAIRSIVEIDGIKMVQEEFVKFRKYA